MTAPDDPDPCPDCDGEGKEWFDGPTATWLKDCRSCGGSGTRPTVTGCIHGIVVGSECMECGEMCDGCTNNMPEHTCRPTVTDVDRLRTLDPPRWDYVIAAARNAVEKRDVQQALGVCETLAAHFGTAPADDPKREWIGKQWA